MHALNTVFAGLEIILPRSDPHPWLLLVPIIIILALYLALAYLTHATEGFYVYSFLDMYVNAFQRDTTMLIQSQTKERKWSCCRSMYWDFGWSDHRIHHCPLPDPASTLDHREQTEYEREAVFSSQGVYCKWRCGRSA